MNALRENSSALLVDDDVCYGRLVELVFESLGLKNRLSILKDPKQLMPFLSQLKDNQPSRLPTLIILDVNMPGPDGIELTKMLRADESYHDIPILVMSTSHYGGKFSEAYRSGANGCIVKPNDLDDFLSTFEVITQYWFSLIVPKDPVG